MPCWFRRERRTRRRCCKLRPFRISRSRRPAPYRNRLFDQGRDRPSADRSCARSRFAPVQSRERGGSIPLQQQRYSEVSCAAPRAGLRLMPERYDAIDSSYRPAERWVLARLKMAAVFTGSRPTTASSRASASSRRPRLLRSDEALPSTLNQMDRAQARARSIAQLQ